MQVIENFVSKAENVLQYEVRQINSLQNIVNSLNVQVEEELSEFSSEVGAEARGKGEYMNCAMYKSSTIIKSHIKEHNSKLAE